MFSMSVSLRQGLFWSFFKRSPLHQGIFMHCAKPDSSVSLSVCSLFRSIYFPLSSWKENFRRKMLYVA